MFLGVHCSVSGGLINAFDEAESLSIDTFQIFTKNQRQWREKVIAEYEGKAFQQRLKNSGIKMVFSHSSYLINLGSPDDAIWLKSVEAITGELNRCHDLGLAFTVLHPGASKGTDEKQAIGNVARGLKIALEATGGSNVKILLENTAGQGSTLGYRFEHLKEIMELTDSDRIGVCMDTCHAFAAGYDIRTKTGFAEMLKEFENVIGLNKLYAIHLNDSKTELGSRVDRHENIGQGKIGLIPFREIMHQFQNIPKVLETPKKGEMDQVNLRVLRNL